MTAELRDRLIVAMHEQSSHWREGPARTCGACTQTVESIMPEIRDWIWNGSDNDDLD